ncbi:microfibrillar-associated protein 1 isoform X2 [Paralichthys olivaceus]
MGLQHKMTFSQASKKWENMKKKYKALKNPADGMKVFPEMWAHFHLMDDAIEGRLEGSAPTLKVFSGDKDNCDFLPISKPKKRRRVSMGISPPMTLVADRPEIEVSLNGDDEEEEEEEEGSLDVNLIMQEVDNERNVMDTERQVMDKEIRLMERERLVLQRERAVLDREVATLERDRATLERERVTIEREKVVLEREKAMVEKDKDAVCRERLALQRERARLERLFAPRETTEEATGNSSEVKDSHAVDMDRKERFLYLFEKLIESF